MDGLELTKEGHLGPGTVLEGSGSGGQNISFGSTVSVLDGILRPTSSAPAPPLTWSVSPPNPPAPR